MHNHPHPDANTVVKIKPNVYHFQYPQFGGSDFKLEDWWDHLAGRSWKDTQENIACAIYAIRAMLNKLPDDDQVVYGRIGMFGFLVHVTEIEKR